MENKIETTNLALLLRLSDLLKEHYKSQDPKDVEVSFEFIIGSLFPKAWHNVQEALIDEHTKGYIEGLQSKYKDFSTCKISGNIEVIKRINDLCWTYRNIPKDESRDYLKSEVLKVILTSFLNNKN